MKKIKALFYILIISALWMLNSCGSSKPFQRYLLIPSAESENVEPGKTDYSQITVALGAVEFPEYLKTPKIVSFQESNKLYLDEYNRWASPLKSNFEKVLLEDISAYVPTDKISFYGEETADQNLYKVNVIVSAFGMQTDSSIVLKARWGIPSEKNAFTLDKKSFFSEDGKDAGYNEQAEIMSGLTAKLAQEIAAEIRRVFDSIKK